MTRIIGSLHVPTKKGRRVNHHSVSSTKLRPADSLGGSHVEKHVLLKHRERGAQKRGGSRTTPNGPECDTWGPHMQNMKARPHHEPTPT